MPMLLCAMAAEAMAAGQGAGGVNQQLYQKVRAAAAPTAALDCRLDCLKEAVALAPLFAKNPAAFVPARQHGQAEDVGYLHMMECVLGGPEAIIKAVDWTAPPAAAAAAGVLGALLKACEALDPAVLALHEHTAAQRQLLNWVWLKGALPLLRQSEGNAQRAADVVAAGLDAAAARLLQTVVEAHDPDAARNPAWRGHEQDLRFYVSLLLALHRSCGVAVAAGRRGLPLWLLAARVLACSACSAAQLPPVPGPGQGTPPCPVGSVPLAAPWKEVVEEAKGWDGRSRMLDELVKRVADGAGAAEALLRGALELPENDVGLRKLLGMKERTGGAGNVAVVACAAYLTTAAVLKAVAEAPGLVDTGGSVLDTAARTGPAKLLALLVGLPPQALLTTCSTATGFPCAAVDVIAACCRAAPSPAAVKRAVAALLATVGGRSDVAALTAVDAFSAVRASAPAEWRADAEKALVAAYLALCRKRARGGGGDAATCDVVKPRLQAFLRAAWEDEEGGVGSPSLRASREALADGLRELIAAPDGAAAWSVAGLPRRVLQSLARGSEGLYVHLLEHVAARVEAGVWPDLCVASELLHAVRIRPDIMWEGASGEPGVGCLHCVLPYGVQTAMTYGTYALPAAGCACPVWEVKKGGTLATILSRLWKLARGAMNMHRQLHKDVPAHACAAAFDILGTVLTILPPNADLASICSHLASVTRASPPPCLAVATLRLAAKVSYHGRFDFSAVWAGAAAPPAQSTPWTALVHLFSVEHSHRVLQTLRQDPEGLLAVAAGAELDAVRQCIVGPYPVAVPGAVCPFASVLTHRRDVCAGAQLAVPVPADGADGLPAPPAKRRKLNLFGAPAAAAPAAGAQAPPPAAAGAAAPPDDLVLLRDVLLDTSRRGNAARLTGHPALRTEILKLLADVVQQLKG
eukprot:TRINITY_DN12250_c0_g1_i1.p1 TRINITY_DN12250_c0_g1~~TRINITY_DN12250_c0_g1_i1.p1  ORF type:complete len:920 (+),score=259.16 TRINITY_DN12250_c0_g1_i1:106-2865(+)